MAMSVTDICSELRVIQEHTGDPATRYALAALLARIEGSEGEVSPWLDHSSPVTESAEP